MKNFILAEAPAIRKESHLLLHISSDVEDKDREVASFSHYSRWLLRKGYSTNTITKYSENVASFLDYLFEASKSDALLSEQLDFEDVVYSYESFMLFGKQASNPLPKELAEKLNKKNQTSPISLAQNIQVSIEWYIEVSLLGLAENGKFDPFFGCFFEKRKTRQRSSTEISKIKDKSWLAGTIRNSLRNLSATTQREALFPGLKRKNKRGQLDKHKVQPFPIELSVNLVRSKKPPRSRTYNRDMALYSLLAATGMRTHEALQLRFIDIITNEDGSTRIELHSPFSRQNPGLTEEESAQLAWKGRETSKTFMIEPFASIFWEHLKNYLELEYNQSVTHDFVFQKENGRPFFTSTRTTRSTTIKKFALKAGLQDISKARLHSLRHMYGTYILNYMPVQGNRQPGLPIVYVQRLMGHASASSTERYSRHDEDVLDAYIEHANKYVMGVGEESLAETRINFHVRQIEALKEEFTKQEWSAA
jgi:integrase